MDKISRIKELTAFLNKCCDEYYNKNNPSISDAQYDALFDELSRLENETGVVLADSPTMRPGYEVISELEKVTHDIPLLSLEKTKSEQTLLDFAKASNGYLALKLDGLTVKLTYQNGVLVEAATRGDGAVGEIITHNARVFVNIPQKIPFDGRLVISGEAFIDIPTFEKINSLIDNDEDKYSTPRNLASGSVRQLDSKICAERGVAFVPFNVLEGLEDTRYDSKLKRLNLLNSFGFELIPLETLTAEDTIDTVTKKIADLKAIANQKGYPIDGIVFTYDSVTFGRAQGRTAHHFKDGIAYKFSDPTFKTTLKEIIWNISRTGQLTPIAEFEAVEIDNTNVERASLHNITFIENLKLQSGDKIMVSKRNMIIPHIEENLSSQNEVRDDYSATVPTHCPVCQAETAIKTTLNSGNEVKVLYCENPLCPGKQIKKFTHFVSKSAMNIDGLSEATLIKFINLGFIKRLRDIFRLDEHKEEIIKLEGFGEKSYKNLIEAISLASKTRLSNLLVALNISLLGKSAAKAIEELFEGDIAAFNTALEKGFDFSEIDGFGETINRAIYAWFGDPQNISEYNDLLEVLSIEKLEKAEVDTSGYFYGKTVVITGKFSERSRDELTLIMQNLGAKVTGSVSAKTDLLLCGEDAGSKLQKAQKLGIKILGESELKELI